MIVRWLFRRWGWGGISALACVLEVLAAAAYLAGAPAVVFTALLGLGAGMAGLIFATWLFSDRSQPKDRHD